MISRKEHGRKIFHVLVWMAVVGLYVLLDRINYGFLFITSLFFVVLIIDILRLYVGLSIPIFSLLRKKEKKTFFTPTKTLFGMVITLAFFDKNIAVASFLMMIFGDAAAPLIGQYGKHWFTFNTKKNWEGAVGEFAVDMLIGMILLRSWLISGMMALVATLVEVHNKHWDDNMVIPFAASLIGTLVKTIF